MTSSRFLITILIAAFVAVCILFAPYFSVFILAIVFGTLFDPFNMALRARFGKTGASLITVTLVLLAIAIILTFVFSQVIREAGTILSGLRSGTILPDAAIAEMQARLNALFPAAEIDLASTFRDGVTWVVHQTGSIFKSIATIVLNLFISIIALYYWFKDSSKFRSAVLKIIPLSHDDASGILNRLSLSIRSLIRGTLMVAVLQGIVAGIGFAIFGIPNVFLWASVAVFCALVPTLGTALIFVPMVAYLALTGATVHAIGLAIWGMFAVGLIDNIFGPRLMSYGSNLHPFFTLMGVLGGVALFGAIGVFAGPIIVSIFLAVSETYATSQEKSE